MDFGKERIEGPEVRAQIRRQARRVYAEAALSASAVAAVLYAIFGRGA